MAPEFYVLWMYYSLLGLGALVSFGWCRFPDLTPDGAVVVGPAVFSLLMAQADYPVPVAMAGGFVSGGACGVVTTGLSSILRIPGFVASMVTSIVSFTVFFELVGSAQINLNEGDILFALWDGQVASHLATRRLYCAVSVLLGLLLTGSLAWLASTWWGLRFRCVGDNPKLARELRFSVRRQRFVGLFFANGSIGVAGCLILSMTGVHRAPMFVTLYALLTMSFGAAIWGQRLRPISAVIIPLTGGLLVALVHHTAIRVSGLPAHWLQAALGIGTVVAFLGLRLRREEGVVASVRFDA